MVEYGVVTSNKFNFLSDDESADPSQILSKAAVIKKTKSTTVQPAAPPAPTNNIPKPERAANKENDVKPRGPPARGGRGAGRGGPRHDGEGRPERTGDGEKRGPRGPRGPRREDGEGRPPRREYDASRRREDGEGRPPRREYNQERNADGELVEGENRRRGPPRGEHGGRGRGAYRGDRASGTGARAGAKRDTHGKGNWGTTEDELKGETEPVAVEGAEAEKPVVEGEEAVEKTAEAVEEEKKEEEAPTFTLEEWKKLHQVEANNNFNVRKANEDKKLNLIPIKKEDLEEKEVEEYITLRREPKKKHVDISVNFTDSNRGGGYGNRGDRPTRGRGGPRPNNSERPPRGDRTADRPPRGDRPARGNFDRPARGGQGRNQGFNLTSEAFPAL